MFFSSAFKFSKVTSFSFSNSSWLNLEFFTPSAIKPNTSEKYFFNDLAEAPELKKFTLAPKKSTFSLNSSLVILLVPLPSKLPIMLETPAISPSK